jgi:hypothetical protein
VTSEWNRKRKRFSIYHFPYFIFHWNGVTGNTSGFEPEDEGSTPSPAANLFTIKQDVSARFIGLARRVARPAVLRLGDCGSLLSGGFNGLRDSALAKRLGGYSFGLAAR